MHFKAFNSPNKNRAKPRARFARAWQRRLTIIGPPAGAGAALARFARSRDCRLVFIKALKS